MNSKILIVDIETAPCLGYFWRTGEQHISPEMIERDPYMLCYSAKFVGESKIYFDAIWNHSLYKKNPYTDKMLAESLHKLLEQADIIVGQNCDEFDLKWINTLFFLHDLKPLPPTKTVDTLKVSRNKFKFISNKLDYLLKRCNLGSKLKHDGFDLWKKCIKGDKSSQKIMREYNINDVIKTEKLYLKMRPFANKHPHDATILDEKNMKCVVCSSTEFQMRGTYKTTTSTFKRYQCKKCGKWHRGSKSILEKGEKILGI